MKKIPFLTYIITIAILINWSPLHAQNPIPKIHVEGNALFQPGTTKLHISEVESLGVGLGVSIGVGDSISNQVVALNLLSADTSFQIDFGNCAFTLSKKDLNDPILMEAVGVDGKKSPSINLSVLDSAIFFNFSNRFLSFYRSDTNGVSMGLNGPTFDTEIISMNLQGDSDEQAVGINLGGNATISFSAANENAILTLKPDTVGGGSSGGSYTVANDFNANEVKESGPPKKYYQHANLVSGYQYDTGNNTVSHFTVDDAPALPDTICVTYNPSMGKMIIKGDLEVTGTISEGGASFKSKSSSTFGNTDFPQITRETLEDRWVINGNILTDQEGFAIVTIPNEFSILNKEFRYQLTVFGEFAQAIVKNKIKNDHFVIQTDKPNIEVSWLVIGSQEK